MISNTTKQLAADYMAIQKALRRSIEEDLKDVNGTLCIQDYLQLWVDDLGINGKRHTVEEIVDALGVPTELDQRISMEYTGINFKIGNVPSIILVRKQKDDSNE